MPYARFKTVETHVGLQLGKGASGLARTTREQENTGLCPVPLRGQPFPRTTASTPSRAAPDSVQSCR